MSVTKNPMILESASYIYSWFQSRIKNHEELEMMNVLEDTKADATYMKYLKTEKSKERYNDFEKRYKEMGDKYDRIK